MGVGLLCDDRMADITVFLMCKNISTGHSVVVACFHNLKCRTCCVIMATRADCAVGMLLSIVVGLDSDSGLNVSIG